MDRAEEVDLEPVLEKATFAHLEEEPSCLYNMFVVHEEDGEFDRSRLKACYTGGL